MTSTNNQVAAPGTVLILGSAGRLGLSVARAFARAGWAVLAQVRPTRDVAQLPEISGVEWLPHALDDLASLVAKAQGASVVVHALNPCYCNIAWRREGPTMMEQAIDVTRRLQATLMFPGNVYNFGSSMPEILSEATPQLATDSKGRVRIAVEQQLAAAARAGGLRAVVIRAGDYFGSGEGSWFDQVLAKNLWKGQITYPGKLDIAHAWAYLPDLASTFVQVAEKRDQLNAFDVLHFAGHTLRGKEWQDALTRVALQLDWLPAGAALKVKRLPWRLLRLLALAIPKYRSVADMHHLWKRPHGLDNKRLTELIGDEPHTSLALASRAAVAELYPHVLDAGGNTSPFAGALS